MSLRRTEIKSTEEKPKRAREAESVTGPLVAGGIFILLVIGMTAAIPFLPKYLPKPSPPPTLDADKYHGLIAEKMTTDISKMVCYKVTRRSRCPYGQYRATEDLVTYTYTQLGSMFKNEKFTNLLAEYKTVVDAAYVRCVSERKEKLLQSNIDTSVTEAYALTQISHEQSSCLMRAVDGVVNKQAPPPQVPSP